MKFQFTGAVECSHKSSPDPEFHPHEKYCYKYYECANGLAYEFTCPAPLNWDQANKECDGNVDCGVLTTSTWNPTTAVL